MPHSKEAVKLPSPKGELTAAMSNKKGGAGFAVILAMSLGGREEKSLNRARPTKAVSVCLLLQAHLRP